jgi:glyoxylase-like metal-dependent hydrolase (beta-lactamase superfamily II)
VGTTPILSEPAAGVVMIDTGMAGERELNAVFLLDGDEPCLIEAAPETDGAAVVAALTERGVGPADLAHVVLTHIHMDHAGGAGALLERYPRATVWVHERGAPHLADPSRLIASTARTYGPERLRELYGGMRPTPPERVRAVVDGDRIALGDRTLRILHTPGHASHHVAILEERDGALFCGEAIGSVLPWGPATRPALPPPEADVEQALASIERMRELRPTSLLTSHYGPTPGVDAGFEAAERGIHAWSDSVRAALEDDDPDENRMTEVLTYLADRRFLDEAGRPLGEEIGRYDVLGSIRMNAQGLTRYWRKRWEAEAAS